MDNNKVLLVDEKLIYADYISHLLEQQGFKIVATANSIEEAIKSSKAIQLDLICVNLLSKEELAGIQKAQKLNEFKNVPIVFITHVLDNQEPLPYAFDHLVDTENADAGFSLVANSSISSRNGANIDAKPKRIIFVKNDYIYEKICIRDILWVEANGAYCKLNTIEKQILLSINLSTFHKYVVNENIVRVHRSYLVNVDKIDAFESNYLHICKELIPLGAKYKSDLARLFPYIMKSGVVI